MRIVEENTGIFAIRASELFGSREDHMDYIGVNCEMFIFRNSNTLRDRVNLLNQDCCNLNDFFHKSDDGNVVTKSVSLSMEGINCSFFGTPSYIYPSYNDKLISGIYERNFVNLNSVDSYNKEEDFDSGKIDKYTKKYVKMNVAPKEIELVLDPSTYMSFFRFLDTENRYVYYCTKSFCIDELTDLIIK
jgi:hypothetical protein